MENLVLYLITILLTFFIKRKSINFSSGIYIYEIIINDFVGILK